MHGHHLHVYMHGSVLEFMTRPPQYLCTKNLVFRVTKPFLVQGVYRLQYEYPTMTLTMVVATC